MNNKYNPVNIYYLVDTVCYPSGDRTVPQETQSHPVSHHSHLF